MKQWIRVAVSVTGLVLALAVTLPAVAAPPEAPWTSGDIGDVAVPGSTDRDGNGVWTIKASGDNIYNYDDSFQFAYQPVQGNGSITARLLSRSGGNSEWQKTGLMIRENLTPGSPNLNYLMAPAHGQHATIRVIQDEGSEGLFEVGPTRFFQRNIFMRLQRVGNEIAGFYSPDGAIWTQAGFSPQTLPTLPETALFGLSVTAHQNPLVATARFDQVEVKQGGLSVYGLQACGGDRSVLLQWRPVPGATGYNLYRRSTATTTELVKLTDTPIAGTTYTDASEGLANATAAHYVVESISADGQATPRVAISATPTAVPGWVGCSINEPGRTGSASLDSASGEITLRGSGSDIQAVGDQFYFLNQLVEGDVQITVKAITKPSSGQNFAKAGLMIRESLHGSARHAFLFLTPSDGLRFIYRGAASGSTDGFYNPQPLPPAALKVPIWIRLTRSGRTITAAYSADGQTFQTVPESFTFDQDLPRTLYIGLAITSVDMSSISTARFTVPEIKKL
jgi:hypothetical protein